MNTSIIRYIIGKVLLIEAAFLLLPCLIALIYREGAGWYFLLTFALCAASGLLLSLRKPRSAIFYLKEGCVATSLSWMVMSLMGCLPFYLSEEIPRFIDALFETVSGFTTTGTTILSDVECLSRCTLMWRSFTHWIGGMGVLVFLLAVVSMSGGGSGMNLMRAESPGPSVGKLVPKITHTARILYLIYIGMTVVLILLLVLFGMPVFDSVATAFGTAGTGGFGIKNDSIGGYSPQIQWIVAIFMTLFGINFNAYYLILFGHFRKALHIEEIRWYLGVIVAASAFITLQILDRTAGIFEAVTQSVFQVSAIITSTGFSTADFDLWPQSSRFTLVFLMFMGACAGSTGGGIKVSRFVLLGKTIRRELTSYIHPRSVRKILMDDAPVEHEVLRSVNVYLITFLAIFVCSMFVISFEPDTDLTTSFTATITTLNNIGPGLSMAGPTENFGFFSTLSKVVFIFDMIAGRLELFPVLILFSPELWKQCIRQFASERRRRKENRQ